MWKLTLAVVLSMWLFGVSNSVPRRSNLFGEIQYTETSSSNIQKKNLRDFVLGSCVVVLTRQCPDKDVTFHLYTKAHAEIPQHVYVGKDLRSSNLSLTSFNPALPTKIIIHGYNSDMHLSVLVEVKTQYLRNKNVNVFAVDWGNLAQGPCYPAAVWNARFVGKCSAQLVERIRQAGAKDIHVIGFSLGAHVTGFIANNLRPYQLPRITGLDPALPGFITVENEGKLDPSDAKFVDIVHTNAFMQGKVEQSGHVDFYVNGGVIQPGCWAENRFFACNHHRAPLYFAESITTDKGFYGWPCPSYFIYLLGRCPPREPQIIMGEHVNHTSRGMHLVITGSISPYALGKYTGPLIEIYFRKAERNRISDLHRFEADVNGWVDEDDLEESLFREQMRRRLRQEEQRRRESERRKTVRDRNRRNREKQKRKKVPELGKVDDFFNVNFNYTEFYNNAGFYV